MRSLGGGVLARVGWALATGCAVLPASVHAQGAESVAMDGPDAGHDGWERASTATDDAPVAGPNPASDAGFLHIVDRRELWGARIRRVELVVPPGMDRGTAEQVLGLRTGEALDADVIRRGIKRMVLLGRLVDVRVWALPQAEGEDSVRLVVELVPARIAREIRFSGVEPAVAQELRRALAIAEGDGIDDASVERAVGDVRRALQAEGYPRGEVTQTAEPLAEPGHYALVFRVRPGHPQKIKSVKVSGDLVYPEVDINEVISPILNLRAERLVAGGLASRSRVASAAERLLKWYRRRGHYSARVEPQPVPVSRAGEWVPVELRVHAGPRWVPVFRGNHVFSSSELMTTLGLPPDRRLDAELAAQLEESIRARYRNAGYLHVRVSLRAAPGTQRGTRRMLFTIREGPFTEIAHVQVTGGRGTGFTEAQLADEAVLAASEDMPQESAIFRRWDPADVDAVLSSGDSEAAAWPQGLDPRAGRTGGTEWPHTWLGRMVDPERTYDQGRFTKGAHAIEDLLKSRGFLQPRVTGPVPSYTVDGSRVHVRYTVHPGVQTRVHSLSFRGNQARPSRDLLDMVQGSASNGRVGLGKPMDLFALEEARLALVEDYANRGYPFATVVDDVQYDPARRLADVVLVVDEGQHVTVGDVVVEGNARTRTELIRAQLTVKSGQVFTRREVEESRRRLMGLALFSSATIELSPDEEGPRRTVRVRVRERRFGEYELGMGLSSEQGPRGFLGVAYRNILGLGIITSARLRLNWPYITYFNPLIPPVSRDRILARFDNVSVRGVPEGAMRFARPLLFTEFEGVLALGYPRTLLLPLSPGIRTEAIAVRVNRLAFSLTKAGVVLTSDIKAPVRRWLRASASPSGTVQVNALQCEGYYVDRDRSGRTCAQDPNRQTYKLDNGALVLGTLRFPFVLDGRDNIFRPHVGYLVNGSADLVGGGGVLFEASPNSRNSCGARTSDREPCTLPVRTTFLRLSGGVTGYVPLSTSVTLAVAIRGGTIFPLGPNETDTPVGRLTHYVPLFERFYLGGPDSVRGFLPDAVLPADDPLEMAPTRLDENGNVRPRPVVSQGGNGFWNVRTELRFPIAGNIEGAVFLDAGQLVYSWLNQPDPLAFSAGTGAGIRVNTPVGPLVFDMGFGFKDGRRTLTTDDLPRRFVPHPAIGYW